MATQERGSATPDSALVHAVAAGRETALGELYDRYGSMAYALALTTLRDPAEAEEVAADVFAQLWRSAGSFEEARGSVRAWIATIARSRSLDRLRARRRAAQRLEDAAHSAEDGFSLPLHSPPPPDRAAEASERGELVRASLAALPPSQREPIEMAYFGGLSQSEIAASLQEPLGTVKTRIRTGMEKLRQMLTPLLREEEP